MKRSIILFLSLLISAMVNAQSFSIAEKALWKKQASTIKIIRDNWGVPHVYTNTDADAVFGMMYVQCEEYFSKVEDVIISRMGRESEVQGKSAIYKDLWSRLYIDTNQAKALYFKCDPYLRKLCDAYAAGINYFILTHPDVKTKLLKRVEPWIPLMNNIPSVTNSNLTDADIKSMYPIKSLEDIAFNNITLFKEDEKAGSNGWAISGKNTKDKNPILLINPHSEFYNRIEVQLVSKEGLNVYGAPFLGEFNIFQGFNEFCGWMHTVTLSDAKDLYIENTKSIPSGYQYEYDNKWLPVDSSKVTIYFKNGNNKDSVSFMTYKTLHGPVVAKRNNSWLAAKTINENIELLNVHWKITKSKSFNEFKGWLNKRVMTGTNTIYADKTGNIGYWHGNFVPIRDSKLNWSLPVPGNVSSTNWKGVHALNDIPNYVNPANGWVQNCNSTPLYGTGVYDSIMAKKPSYMLPDGHTPRAVNAVRQLKNIHNATIDTILNMCHDAYLANAAKFIPSLIHAYDSLGQANHLKEPMNILRHWNFYTDTTSVPTTLAVLWVEKIMQLNLAKLKRPLTNEISYSISNGSTISLQNISAATQVALLDTVIIDLQKDWGTWSVAWGQLNRFQRNALGQEPSDALPSLAVTATPAFMGSINAYTSKKSKNSKVRYGTTGNTFVAVVSFGNKLKGKSIYTGGASSNPNSKHFTDQANGYINHQYKNINFYLEDVLKNKELVYHPGENVY
jgi:acyl-homoserine lactone acylase PvdQ